jgi:hypothetical protein
MEAAERILVGVIRNFTGNIEFCLPTDWWYLFVWLPFGSKKYTFLFVTLNSKELHAFHDQFFCSAVRVGKKT